MWVCSPFHFYIDPVAPQPKLRPNRNANDVELIVTLYTVTTSISVCIFSVTFNISHLTSYCTHFKRACGSDLIHCAHNVNPAAQQQLLRQGWISEQSIRFTNVCTRRDDYYCTVLSSPFGCSLGLRRGRARTQVPTTRNYTVELPTFAVIAEVSQCVVQCKSLALKETPRWSGLTFPSGKYALFLQLFSAE